MSTVSDLIARLDSDDSDTRALALGDLIARGKSATTGLTQALRRANPTTRALAAEGLEKIADPAAADALAAAVDDADPKVRSRAAVALAALHDRRALDALIRTLDDFPDLAHGEFTLSAYALMRYGPEALPVIVSALKAPQQITRTQAIWIIRRNVAPMLGGDDAAWDKLWRKLGSYDPAGPKAARDRAAGEWAAWVAEHAPPESGRSPAPQP
jgi:HEAT repeat protein